MSSNKNMHAQTNWIGRTLLKVLNIFQYHQKNKKFKKIKIKRNKSRWTSYRHAGSWHDGVSSTEEEAVPAGFQTDVTDWSIAVADVTIYVIDHCVVSGNTCTCFWTAWKSKNVLFAYICIYASAACSVCVCVFVCVCVCLCVCVSVSYTHLTLPTMYCV